MVIMAIRLRPIALALLLLFLIQLKLFLIFKTPAGLILILGQEDNAARVLTAALAILPLILWWRDLIVLLMALNTRLFLPRPRAILLLITPDPLAAHQSPMKHLLSLPAWP